MPYEHKVAPKSYFAYYSCMAIILFNASLYKCAFSMYSLGKLVFCLPVFSALSTCFFVLNSMSFLYTLLHLCNIQGALEFYSHFIESNCKNKCGIVKNRL